MRYLNGKLPAEPDSTLWISPHSQNRKLAWQEYLPLAILGVLLVCLLAVTLTG